DQEDLRLDYAFRPLGDLGSDQRFSLSFFTPGTAQDGSAKEESAESGLWLPGAWQLSLHGGGAYYLPYSAADLEAPYKTFRDAVDISPNYAPLGGLSLGRELGGGWLAELGAEALAFRRIHSHLEGFGLFDFDSEQSLQPLLFYVASAYRWPLGP